MHMLQHCVPMLSALLMALSLDVLSRIAPALRDHLSPLFGIPARMAQRLEKKLNLLSRPKGVRAARGITSLGALVVLGLILGAGAKGLAAQNSLVEPLMWFVLLRVTQPWSAGYEVLRALQQNKDSAARKILEKRHIAFSGGDRHAAVRAVLENVALSLSNGFAVPVFYGMVAACVGLSPLFAVVLVVTLCEAIRVIVTIERLNQPFMQSFATLENLINFVPARIAAFFIALAALFTPRANPMAALRSMFAQGAWHVQPNKGWVLAALAGALNVALPSGNAAHEWLGPSGATARADTNQLKSGLWLHAVALGLFSLVLISLLFIGLAV